jgi:hypothetical protein
MRFYFLRLVLWLCSVEFVCGCFGCIGCHKLHCSVALVLPFKVLLADLSALLWLVCVWLLTEQQSRVFVVYILYLTSLSMLCAFSLWSLSSPGFEKFFLHIGHLNSNSNFLTPQTYTSTEPYINL